MDKRITVRGIIVRNNKIMLMYRERKKDNELLKYYSLPGGAIEKDETNEQALIREVKEEFNVDVKVLKYLGYIESDNRIEYIYSCKYLRGEIELIGEEKKINSIDNYYEPLEVEVKDIDNLNLRYKDIIKEGIRYSE